VEPSSAVQSLSSGLVKPVAVIEGFHVDAPLLQLLLMFLLTHPAYEGIHLSDVSALL
jgi:hypothetical protein